VAVDPTDSAVVYAGTPVGKIFKSQDGGQTWKCLHELPGKASVMCIAVAQADPKLILAATTTAGILRSEDAGVTWTPLDTPKAATSAVIAPSDPAILYASFGKDGVRKSADRGKTWAAVGPGIDAKCSVTEVAVDPKDPATVYAIGEVGWNGNFYRSTDGGQTWTENRRMKRDLAADPTLPEEGGKDAETPTISRPRNLAINPLSPKELFVAGNWRLCFSPDGGQTWEERDRGADITCVSDIRFSGPRTYVTSMDEGLMVSDDQGAAWRQLSPRKHSKDVSGHQWRVLIWPKGDTERILTTCSPWADPPNRVLISEDGGRSFRQSVEGLPNYRPKPNTMWGEGYAHALAADPKDPNVIYLGIDGDPEPAAGRAGGGVFKSVDGGATWKQLPNQPGSRRMFYGLAVDPTDSNRVFWGACGTGGLWRSDDAGNSWKHVFKNEWWVFNIALSPAGVVYCPGANLWRSDDHGDQWKKITPFDYGVSIVGLEVHPRDEKTLWISRVTWSTKADGGVYKTTDGAATALPSLFFQPERLGRNSPGQRPCHYPHF
ncbi:MAG: hypothetical protein NT049_04265, partial [Planctomycetota bacterium]|nr:hypothetical protein [Planctomycetota bacterium]